MPTDILIRQEDTVRGWFHVVDLNGSFQTLCRNVKELTGFLSDHDYRYIPGTFGEWRLP